MIGSFHSDAMFSVSWKAPCFDAPSPKNATDTAPSWLILDASAEPVAVSGIRSATLTNMCQSVVTTLPIVGDITLKRGKTNDRSWWDWIKEVQEGTAVGDMLRRDLIRSQLAVTLRYAAFAALVLGVLPALFTLLPEVGRLDVFGLRVPWLILGVLMYPFLVGVAWRYCHAADRREQDFADHVQD